MSIAELRARHQESIKTAMKELADKMQTPGTTREEMRVMQREYDVESRKTLEAFKNQLTKLVLGPRSL